MLESALAEHKSFAESIADCIDHQIGKLFDIAVGIVVVAVAVVDRLLDSLVGIAVVLVVGVELAEHRQTGR